VTPPLPRTLRWRVCLTNLGAIVAGPVRCSPPTVRLRLLFPSEVPK
jgi:hypothetical protein